MSASLQSGSNANSGGIFWKSDFEDGTLGIPNVWFTDQIGTYPDCLRVVKTGSAAHGSYVLDIHVHPDDAPAHGDKEGFKSRDELSQGGTGDLTKSIARTHSGPGQTAYYRVAYFFPQDFNPNQHGYNIITQFHAAGAGARPSLSILADAKASPCKLQLQTDGIASARPETKSWEIGTVPSSPAWVEVIFGVHWAADSSGWVEVWRREGLSGSWQNVLPRTNASTLYGDTNPPGSYMKLGYYRGPDGKIGKATGPWPGVSHLIIDNVMAGDTLESVRNEEPK